MSISVGVPAYNQGQYLAETLDSLLCQAVPPTEIVVSDNHSTDQTPEILRQYEGRVRIIRPPEHLSMTAHWNFVVESWRRVVLAAEFGRRGRAALHQAPGARPHARSERGTRQGWLAHDLTEWGDHRALSAVVDVKRYRTPTDPSGAASGIEGVVLSIPVSSVRLEWGRGVPRGLAIPGRPRSLATAQCGRQLRHDSQVGRSVSNRRSRESDHWAMDRQRARRSRERVGGRAPSRWRPWAVMSDSYAGGCHVSAYRVPRSGKCGFGR